MRGATETMGNPPSSQTLGFCCFRVRSWAPNRRTELPRAALFAQRWQLSWDLESVRGLDELAELKGDPPHSKVRVRNCILSLRGAPRVMPDTSSLLTSTSHLEPHICLYLYARLALCILIFVI